MTTLTVDTTGSFVKINRVTNGWTWNISVGKSGNTLDELREAKRTALQLDAELREELQRTNTTSIPF